MARTRNTIPKPTPAIAWRDTVSNVCRVIDADPRLVPEALQVLLADTDVAALVVKGSGNLAAFSETIIDVDALDPKADPMEDWSNSDLDLVYEQVAFMAAQRDALHTCAVVRSLRASGCFPGV